jgi:hypothetical protein
MNDADNQGKSLEKRPESTQLPSEPATWPGFAARLAELVAESWENVFRLSVFLLALALAGLAWWWLHGLIW